MHLNMASKQEVKHILASQMQWNIPAQQKEFRSPPLLLDHNQCVKQQHAFIFR